MAHYADGTPAKVGDLIVNRQGWNKNSETILIVIGIQPSSDSCNASAIPLAVRPVEGNPCFPMGPQSSWTVTLKECMRMDAPEFPEAG